MIKKYLFKQVRDEKHLSVYRKSHLWLCKDGLAKIYKNVPNELELTVSDKYFPHAKKFSLRGGNVVHIVNGKTISVLDLLVQDIYPHWSIHYNAKGYFKLKKIA